MSRQPNYFSRIVCSLGAILLASMFGCGGSEPTTDAQASPAPAAGNEQANFAANYDGGQGAGYGGEGQQSGEAYGGGGYGGGSADSGYGSGSGGYSPEDMNPGTIGGSYAGGSYGSEGSGSGMPGYGAGYGAGEPGYGGGMEGYGGGGGAPASPEFATTMQFVRQNCFNCHAQQQAKGDIRLDGLTANFEDMHNSALWSSVMEQVESGEMPPRNIPRRPDPRQQTAAVSWIKTSLSGANYVPLEEQDYLSQAKYAFARSQETQAIDLLYAHSIATDAEGGNELLANARWFALGPRPVLSLRFAVAAVVDAPETLKDLKPIGVSQAGGGGGGGESFGGGLGFGNAPGAGAESSQRSFQQLTGDFGEELAAGFESRWASGKFGAALKDVVLDVPKTAAPGMGGGFGGGAGAGYGGGSYGAGAYEGSLGGEYSGGMGAGPGASNPTSSRKRVDPDSNISPGLFFLGSGSQVEMLAKAQELGVDGLFLFDIKASQNRRNSLVTNQTKLRFMTPDGKTLAATSALDNVEIERNKLRGQEDDSLRKNIDRFFGLFDEKVQLSPMPALKPEHAQARMRQLLVDKSSSNLAKMFEARLYHSMDLLTQDELSKIYQIVMRGNEGVALASGTLDDRRLVLGEVLVQ